MKPLPAALIAALTLGASAGAQPVADHLKCYKVKDPLKLAGLADMDTPQFLADPGCNISKAKWFCVAATKTNVTVTDKTTHVPITPLPVTGPNPGDRICYKVKCFVPGPASQEVTDQFGTRVLSGVGAVPQFKADFLCTPAFKGSARYVDNGDGTVTDNYTGLQWEKKVAGSSCPNCVDDAHSWCVGYPNCTNPSNQPDGTAFTDFLGTLNDCTSSDGTVVTDAGFAGHCDWRLPTSQELDTIFDSGQGTCGGGSGACINPIFGPTTVVGSYWSATSYASGSIYAWLVNFSTGVTFAGRKGNADPVRAVRRAGP